MGVAGSGGWLHVVTDNQILRHSEYTVFCCQRVVLHGLLWIRTQIWQDNFRTCLLVGPKMGNTTEYNWIQPISGCAPIMFIETHFEATRSYTSGMRRANWCGSFSCISFWTVVMSLLVWAPEDFRLSVTLLFEMVVFHFQWLFRRW